MDRSLGASLTTRPAEPSDLGAVFDLLVEYEQAMAGWVETSFEDLSALTRIRGFEFPKNLFVVWDEDGMAGFAMLWNGDPDNAPSDSFMVVRPRRDGHQIRPYLLDRLQDRHRDICSGRPKSSPLLWVHTEASDAESIRFLESEGYTAIRRHYTMEISLGALSRPADPDGFEIRAIAEDGLPTFHELLEETFAEHWGNTPETFEEFYATSYERPDTRLDMWLVAWDDGNPAAVMLGRIKDGVGWVDALGVLKPYRKRGLGEALLRRALWMFQEEGVERALLGVDASNATGAVALYERAGMSSVRIFASYEKKVG